MEFSKKIQELRSRAQETQAANKIIDMLTQLKLKNDNITSYRWIWELVQNAKDVVNTSGQVDIDISFDEFNKLIEFKHNGKLFSTENIVFLIEQVSTKDRTITDEKSKMATGKFGTGFLTTHLLSEKVKVSGYLQDLGESPCKFSVALDRSGTNKESIINAIKESCLQLDKNTTFICDETISETDFNTCFTYHLNESGELTAKMGLKNLDISAPYVLAFVPEINSITVRNGQYIQKFNREEIIKTDLENAQVTRISISTKNQRKDRYIFVLGSYDLNIAVEVEMKGKHHFVSKFDSQLPRVFCDFPLLGTDDFSFPVVVNSSMFNPTEPRNGIHLTDKEHEQITENKQTLKEACQLYFKMLDYFLAKDYQGIYNIVKIPEQPDKDWISKAWFNQEVIDLLKSRIIEILNIYTHNGQRQPLYDYQGTPCVLIPKDTDNNVRDNVWVLSSKIIPQMITKHEELECWYNSLWEECHNYSIVDLIEKVELFNNIENLSENVSDNVMDWLNALLTLYYEKENAIDNSYFRNPCILPNQNGEFCTIDKLLIDCNIDEIYKAMALKIGLDFKSNLLDTKIKREFLPSIKEFTFDDVFSEIEKKLHSNNLQADDFYKTVICLQAEYNKEQEDFLILFKKDNWKRNKVSKFSKELLKEALNFWREKISKQIGSCKCVENFTAQFCFANEQQAVTWLSKFIQLLVKYKQENLLDRIAMLPNQYGDFKKCAELNRDSGEIEEILKDACKYSGYDVRETLLSKVIILQLPENRTINLENISEKITKYVKENKNSLGQKNFEEKEIFQNTYLWLRENQDNESVKNCFKDLLANLHWFYNDNDIAENISQVEEYNNILKKYGVTGIQELEKILSHSDINGNSREAIGISKELLAQWGIATEDELQRALSSNLLGADFIHNSKPNYEIFNYVNEILLRSRKNIFEYLSKQAEYDVLDYLEISKTIFVIKKHDSQIYIIARPSDYDQVILYYDSELDLLDYEKDCELWVEDGKSNPQKITFGKILKLTGVNKIPLRSIRENDRH